MVYGNTIQNPGFETGDLTGWTVIDGRAFGPQSVSNETTYWAEGIPYQQEGTYHLNGWRYQETETGRLRSSTFNLGGSGWITFMLGGGRHTDQNYIEIHNADTGEIIGRYGNSEWSDANFPFVEKGLRLANLVKYKADLRNYIGQNMYIDIVDNGTQDWGLLFADSFETYYESEPSSALRADNLYDASPKEIINPGFETGDLTGWTVLEGGAFGPDSISNEKTYWDEKIPYHQEGEYHLNGWKYPESETGKLRSSTFKLKGSGWITFRLGGGKNTDLAYVNVRHADTGEVVARYGNTGFADVNFPHVEQGLRLANMVQYKADLRAFLGESLYVEIVDNAVNDWGVLFADDFQTYYPESPVVGELAKNLHDPLTYEILNPGFERGSLFGWTVVAGEAFGPSSVSSDTTWWAEQIPYNQEGQYHLNGWMYNEEKTGILRSSKFTLGGSGWITFKLGGGKNTDLVYIDLYNANTDELVARYGNTEFADIHFPNVDQGMRLANMVQYKADLSNHLNEEFYFEIVDNAKSDWGMIFADAFFTHHESIPTDGVTAVNLHSSTKVDIENPGFETGDLSGWRVEGDAFNDAVTNAMEHGDSHTSYGHAGVYHALGSKGGDHLTGTLTSSTFKLTGTGMISFLVGGSQNIDQSYVALVRASDQEILMKATGTQSESYSRVTWDATNYIGQELFIQVVDRNTSGHINVDDFVVNGSGLIGSWSFNEGTGKSVNDQVRNRNDVVQYVFNEAKYKPSTDPLWKKGVSGSGLLFDGYSTWVTRPANEIAKPGDELTIEGWVAPRSYEWGDQNKLSAIVNQYDSAKRAGYILGMGRHGKWSFQVGINGKWTEVWAADNKPLKKFEWSHVAATYSKSTGALKLYLNGELVGTSIAEKKLAITPANVDFIIGKNNSGAIIGGVFTANMFNGLIDELKVYNKALTDEEVKNGYLAVKSGFESGTAPTPELDFDRSVYDGDRYRPQYHFIAPGHWMNEPHGPLYFQGKYHIFYQNNPQGPYWHQIHWGHAVSDDMVHWEDMPVALAPDGGSETPDGVWSGNAVVDDNGNPALFFTAGNDKATPNQATGLARSTYAEDGDVNLKEWVYHGAPVTTQAPNLHAEEGEVWYGNFRDPYVWKDGDTWYQLVGSGIKGVGGTALMYTSTDMIHWTYQKPFFVGDYEKYHKTGQVWELPVLLPIGEDSSGNKKYVFLINPWFDHYDEDNVKYVYHWIGTWDKENHKFIPDHEEPRLFDFGEHFTGPSGMIDNQGRSILFSIAQDRRTEQQHYDSGWAHNAGLPVVLSLRGDHTLGVEPIQELDSLRGPKLIDVEQSSVASANTELQKVQGDMLEIVLKANIGTAKKLGISLRATADGQEETKLYYDVDKKELAVDRWKTSLDPDVQKGMNSGHMELDNNVLSLHIYLDRSMVEAYANGKNSITTRVYPTRSDALGLKLWSEGGEAEIQSLQVWLMNSAYNSTAKAYWPDTVPQTEAVGELTNHDFELGNLTGWTAEGNAFTNEHVTKRNDWGWGGPFGQSWDRKDPERHHLWGIHPDYGDLATGSLKSEPFILGGNGRIDFLIGGGNHIDTLYAALVRASDNQILMKATGQDNEAYRRVIWDASAYKGQQLYIKFVDEHTGGWGHLNIDDVNVPVQVSRPQPETSGGSSGSSATITAPIPIKGVLSLSADHIKRVTNANGQTVAKAVIDAKTLKSLFSSIQASSSKNVMIEVPVQDKESLQLSLDFAALQDAAKVSPESVITIKSGIVTYDLPLALLKHASMTGEMDYIQIAIEPQTERMLEVIRSQAAASSMKLLAGAYDFKVLAEKDDVATEIEDFGNLYVSRSMTIDASGKLDTITAVMYVPETGEISFVPSTFERKDGKTVVTIKRNGNSIYTVVDFNKDFADAKEHWAKEEIHLLASKHIVQGVSEQSYEPERKVTRAEFAAILARGLGLSSQPNKGTVFSDIVASEWYAGAVGAVVKAGLISGYEDGTFKPNQQITRAEMAVMLSRAATFIGVKLGAGTGGDQQLQSFVDAHEIGAWAKPAIVELLEAKLIQGRSTVTIDASAHLTRAESAVVLKRFLTTIEFIN
uniref:GH32 C-terminal domain-containing protein n=1 Tax=Paenibacillus puerhi TaxID=2692622 RepID=UPI002E27C27A|nr:GH32 C-terminal domain-containing protein [Paenibacillus puerhi]